jgi:hypothetical protein
LLDLAARRAEMTQRVGEQKGEIELVLRAVQKLPTESPPALGAHRHRPQSTGAASPGTAFHTHSSLRSDGMLLPELHASFTQVERERSAFPIEARIRQKIEFTLQSIDPQQTQIRPVRVPP